MRGVFSKYTMPLWYGYDHPMTKDELLEIIRTIQSYGYHVTGITVDNFRDNVTLAKELGVTDELPRFKNPSEGKENEYIYFLFDVIHTVKLLRNHLIDDGELQHFILFCLNLDTSFLSLKYRFCINLTRLSHSNRSG